MPYVCKGKKLWILRIRIGSGSGTLQETAAKLFLKRQGERLIQGLAGGQCRTFGEGSCYSALLHVVRTVKWRGQLLV
jgi:hypothetical protein